jgi:hypothetical protein
MHTPHTSTAQPNAHHEAGGSNVDVFAWDLVQGDARQPAEGEFVSASSPDVDSALWNDLADQQTAKLYELLDDILDYLRVRHLSFCALTEADKSCAHKTIGYVASTRLLNDVEAGACTCT